MNTLTTITATHTPMVGGLGVTSCRTCNKAIQFSKSVGHYLTYTEGVIRCVVSNKVNA